MTNELKDKKVVIIGGSSGIGLAAATALARNGAHVVIASRSREKLDAALAEIGGNSEAHMLDVTNEQDVRAFFETIGEFDHLATPASTALGGPFLEVETGEARALVESKLWGQYHAVKHGAPRMRPDGSITLFSGIVSRKPMAGYSSFTIVAGAIESLTRVLAAELAPIRVNCITPGVIDTPAWDIMPVDDRAGMMEGVAGMLPAGRVGVADDVAKAVLYMMSNGFSTGAIADVDGGHRCL